MLDVADKLGSVLSALVGLLGLALTAYGLFLTRRGESPVRTTRYEATPEESPVPRLYVPPRSEWVPPSNYLPAGSSATPQGDTWPAGSDDRECAPHFQQAQSPRPAQPAGGVDAGQGWGQQYPGQGASPWQNELWRLDADLAAGRITAEDYGSRRDAVLAQAGSEPTTVPPPASPSQPQQGWFEDPTPFVPPPVPPAGGFGMSYDRPEVFEAASQAWYRRPVPNIAGGLTLVALAIVLGLLL